MAPAKKTTVSAKKRKANDTLTSSTSKKSRAKPKLTPIGVNLSQTEKTLPMTGTAKQARAGQRTVIIDSSDDTDGEGNRMSQASTADKSTRPAVSAAASETSDIEEVADDTINSEDELGE
jgi:hypothetical protein